MTYTAVINLIVAPVVLTLIYVYALAKIIKNEKAANRRSIQSLMMTGFYLVAMVIIFTVPLLDAKDILQLVLTVGLVVATVSYAISANKQADVSVSMAKEMREQRRPIVVPKAFPAIGVPLEATTEEIEEHRYSDYFQIYSKGNGPAINLEVLLLNHEKSQFGCLKETVFSQGDKPLVFHPSGLVNHLQSTCYLVCRYCSVLSIEERQIWYETWLPFIPKKSQRGDQIIIVPEELDFHEEFERKSY